MILGVLLFVGKSNLCKVKLAAIALMLIQK